MRDTPDSEFLALQEAVAGRYSIQREIGRGGMGIVYLAVDVRLDRPVALKLLPPEMAAQPALRERFLREARTAAKLSHPNIVPIHAVDEVGDVVFFAMMFVEGETLGERVRGRGPLPPSEATRILREVAWALAYAHQHGVVHRDVKPDNILLEAERGRALVTDFGIAHVGSEPEMTSVGEILGTAEFMSPEQAAGDPVDERSDLYSLGVVGHYMVSGRLPFEGATVAATLAKHITQEAPPLSSVAPQAPRDLAKAMDRCLLKDPAQRFADGEELAGALSRALEVRRDRPVAIRMFAEQNQQSSSSVIGMAFASVFSVILGVTVAIAEGIAGVDAVVLWTAFTIALASVPVVMLRHMARRLLEAGYDYDELIQALRSEVEEHRQELASTFQTKPTWADRWANRLAFGSLGVLLAQIVVFPFLPPAYYNAFGWPFAFAFPTLIGAGTFSATRHQIRGTVPGQRWFKFWKSRVGRWLFKLAGVRLDRVESGGAPYRPTEMAIGMAADRLFEELPKDQRHSFKELPAVVRTLEADAEKMRARVKELDKLLDSIEDDEALSRGGTVAAAPGVGDRRESLSADVRTARDAAGNRLSEAIAALETIRLELLRLHAGAGNVESMTADLTSAQELSMDIRRMLEGRQEVEQLLGGPASSD